MARLTLFGVVFLTVKVLVSISRVKEKRFVIPYLINQKKVTRFLLKQKLLPTNIFTEPFCLQLIRDESFCQRIFLPANFLTQVVTLSLDNNMF